MDKFNEFYDSFGKKAPHYADTQPMKKVQKLGKKITDVFDHKLSPKALPTTAPEYWGIAGVVTEEMADVCLKMKVRHHYSFDQMCKMNKIPNTKEDREKFEEFLMKMARVGILEFDYGNHYTHDHKGVDKEYDHPEENAKPDPAQRRWTLPIFVPGSAEVLNMHTDQVEAHPELSSFFERMTYVPLAGITNMVPPGGAGVGMHVIPVEKAIEMENQTVNLEKLSYWLKKYEGHIGVGICSCRYSREKLGEGCGDDYDGWCIGVGDFADYCRETGMGHDITYDEAMEILKKAETLGYVHQITNIDGEDKIFGICNCNVKICNALRTSMMFNTPNLSRSAFTAKVEPENCVACGKCVEVCPAGAVKLGQKLCTKDGPVKYPKIELPTHAPFSWGEEHWRPNYRDENAENCYDTGTAPCKTACPAHIAIQGYLKLANQGRYKEALRLIKKDNPFPAVCGRICNKRCEDACTRGVVDKAINIDEVKKFIAEQDLHAKTRFVPEIEMPASPCAVHPKTQFDEKIAIIGAGPAGLSAAYYLAIKGYKPTVFDKNALPGGMLTYGIPSFKLEKDVVAAEIDILRELGVEFKCNTEVGKDVTIPELRKQGYKAFYVAIGCQGGRLPGVPNDNAKNTYIAVDFLKHAIENNDQKMAGDVVVVGGGNVAIDCARTAHRFGAKNVTMVCLESRETMPASVVEIQEAEEEGVVMNPGWGPKELKVNDKGEVTEIVFKKCVSTIDPETKRFNPKYDENETITIKADHVVFAIGQAIVWGDMLKGTKVEFWHGNYPVADKLTHQTAEPDIFVGGDVFTGPKFVIDAIAQGHMDADSLHRFVQPGTSMTIGKDKREFKELDKNNIVLPEYDKAQRTVPAVDPSIDGKNSFKDNRLCLTEEQVKTETARCLSCGASVVDPNRCIGCGLCTTKCEFDAIHLHRDHPECTKMVNSDDKFKYILPFALKESVKMIFKKKKKED